MSTRCSILLKKPSEAKQSLFYRHCDGYDIHNDLVSFLKDTYLGYGTTTNFEDIHYAMAESYSLDVRKLDSSDVPGDIQYLAVVDLDTEILNTYYIPIEMNATINDVNKYEVDAHFTFNKENMEHTGLVKHLNTILPTGAVYFTYKKVNGEERKAVGTLKKELSQKLADYEYKGDETAPGVIKYWDLEADGWRALKEENLVSVEKIEFTYKKD